MALNAHQKIVADDINYRLAAASERGVICTVASTAGQCEVIADPSGARVAGILMMDVVAKAVPSNLSQDANLDTGTATEQSNKQKNETYEGGVVRLARKGELVTDQISGAVAAGDSLYVAASGQISATQAAGSQAIGFALDAKDADGFVKLFLDC